MNITAFGIAALAITSAAPGCEAPEQAGETDEASANDAAPEGHEEVGTASQALGCVCDVHCTVAKVKPDAYCPSTIGGHGRTIFLGSCRKACDRARDNAKSKLVDGCVIDECSESNH